MLRQAIAAQMLDASKPAQFKALGRKVKGFDEKKWNASEPSGRTLHSLLMANTS